MGNRDDMVLPEFGAKNHTLPSETDANLAATASPDEATWRPPSPVSSFSASTLARKGEPVPYGVLKGLSGLRAGWRLLIFIAMLVPLYYGRSRLSTRPSAAAHRDIPADGQRL